MTRQTVAEEKLWACRSNFSFSNALFGASQLMGSVGWYLETGLKRHCSPSPVELGAIPPFSLGEMGKLDFSAESHGPPPPKCFLSQVSGSHLGSPQSSMQHVCSQLFPKMLSIFTSFGPFLGKKQMRLRV